MRGVVAAALFSLWAGVCSAGSISFTGNLFDQNSFTLLQFDIAGASSAVTVQSWSFGGGTNLAGAAIPAGGFLPDISVFGPGPVYPLLADTNFTYSCPPGNLDSFEVLCGDTTLLLNLAAGSYTLAIVAAPNFPLGPTLADGFNGGGSFIGNYGESRANSYAVDVSGPGVQQPALVPEPATLLLFASGAAFLLRKLHKRHPNSRA